MIIIFFKSKFGSRHQIWLNLIPIDNKDSIDSNNDLAPHMWPTIMENNVNHPSTHICITWPQWVTKSLFLIKCCENCVLYLFSWIVSNVVQWNLYETRKVLLKHKNFIICLAWSFQNHVYSPCHERPPVLRDHKIWRSLYTGFTVFAKNYINAMLWVCEMASHLYNLQWNLQLIEAEWCIYASVK